MTANMKAKDIRRRASSDLREEIKRLEKAVFDHRFRGQSEEKTDRGLVRRSRRDVARILTILHQRTLAGTEGVGASGGGSPSGSGVVAKRVEAAKRPTRKAAAGKKE